MQVIIQEVVSHLRAVSSDTALSAKTIGSIVDAVMRAIESHDRQSADVEEELSLNNYQERNRLGAE